MSVGGVCGHTKVSMTCLCRIVKMITNNYQGFSVGAPEVGLD